LFGEGCAKWGGNKTVQTYYFVVVSRRAGKEEKTDRVKSCCWRQIRRVKGG